MSEFISLVEANPYAEWAINNVQTRMLCDTANFSGPSDNSMAASARDNLERHYTIIGFQERLEEFFDALASLCGFRPETPDLVNETGPYKEHVEPEHLAFAARHNALDMQLYEWARYKFPSCGRPSPIATARANADFRKLVVGRDYFEINVVSDGMLVYPTDTKNA
ncbi:MAG TPA: hypothetical protein VNR39_19740 [Pseudolabrys sp.]|nr:hypothetical protein [Pseudolabrys sp.]